MVTERRPLAKIVSEGKRQRMVHLPTRWPQAIVERFKERAALKKMTLADVVRECGIAGLGFIETEEALVEYRRGTL